MIIKGADYFIPQNLNVGQRSNISAGSVPIHRETGLTQYRILLLQMSIYVMEGVKCALRLASLRLALFIEQTLYISYFSGNFRVPLLLDGSLDGSVVYWIGE